MVVEPRQALLGIDNEVPLWAQLSGLAGEPSGGVIDWSTSDSTIVALDNSFTPSAIGLREGTAVVTASRRGVSASIPITVRAGASPVVIEDFHLVEETYEARYAEETTTWSYAPKLRLRGSSERPATAIAGWEVSIPGRGDVARCRSNVTLSSDVSFELFGEDYGDYAYQLGAQGGRMSPDTLALIRVTVRAADGATVVVRGWGPAVPAVRAPLYEGYVLPGLCLYP